MANTMADTDGLSRESSENIVQAIESGDLEKISGGYLLHVARGYEGVEGLRWEVIDDGNGSIQGRYKTRKEALEGAKAKGQSTKQLDWEEVAALRNPNKWAGKK